MPELDAGAAHAGRTGPAAPIIAAARNVLITQTQTESASFASTDGIARTAEIARSAPPVPTLIWRTVADAGLRGRSNAVSHDSALMRSEADGGDRGAISPATGRAPLPEDPVASAPSFASALQVTPPSLDLDEIAEQVTRLIVRQLEAERDRRGGATWI